MLVLKNGLSFLHMPVIKMAQKAAAFPCLDCHTDYLSLLASTMFLPITILGDSKEVGQTWEGKPGLDSSKGSRKVLLQWERELKVTHPEAGMFSRFPWRLAAPTPRRPRIAPRWWPPAGRQEDQPLSLTAALEYSVGLHWYLSTWHPGSCVWGPRWRHEMDLTY